MTSRGAEHRDLIRLSELSLVGLVVAGERDPAAVTGCFEVSRQLDPLGPDIDATARTVLRAALVVAVRGESIDATTVRAELVRSGESIDATDSMLADVEAARVESERRWKVAAARARRGGARGEETR
jgi:hypothetical protein